MTPSQRRPAARARGSTASRPVSDSSTERLTFARLCDSLGRQEDVDLVEGAAVGRVGVEQRERRVEPLLVRDQDADRDVLRDVDRAEHLGGVGELRDDVGPHEARDLQPPQPGAREQVDEPDLLGGRDDLGLVLEAVARPDLADPDGVRQPARAAHDIDRPPLTFSVWPVT